MSVIKYLLDEDVAKFLGTAIERADFRIRVARVGQTGAPEVGALGPALLAWAQSNGYTMVTREQAELPGHAKGQHTSGVFIVRAGFTVREIVEALILIQNESAVEDWQDHVAYVPLA